MPDHLPPCGCRLHRLRRDEDLFDDSDRKVLTDVAGHGWHLVGINPRPGRPAWVFSVGVGHTFRAPEIAMFGADV